MKVGSEQAIDLKGMDNWEWTETDLMEVGIMGFAVNTGITSNQPTLDNFNYTIY